MTTVESAPQKMGLTEDEAGNSTRGLAQIIIAKHRNGAVTDVDLRFREEFARFEEFNEDFLQPLGDTEGANNIASFESKMNTDDNFFDSNQNDSDIFDFGGIDNNEGDAPF